MQQKQPEYCNEQTVIEPLVFVGVLFFLVFEVSIRELNILDLNIGFYQCFHPYSQLQRSGPGQNARDVLKS